jgi:tRNA-specific 2-thiouridylase
MIRYRGKNIQAKLEKINKEKILVKFSEEQNSVASGQILVIYDGENCLGEGEIF